MGMDIQMLDGIDIQMLDGTDGLDGRQRRAVNALNALAARQAWARRKSIEQSTRGVTNAMAAEAASVANGLDLAGAEAEDTIGYEESLRNYVQRTKDIVDAAPVAVSEYQNPRDLSRMLGYVLDNWDSANREQAVENMAREEERLIRDGHIDVNLAGDADDKDEDGEKPQKGFFRNLKRALKPRLSDANAELVAANPATIKKRGQMRRATKLSRKARVKTISTPTGTEYVRTETATANDVAGIGGLDGIDGDLDALMHGTDLDENNGPEGVGTYLARTLRVAERQPDVFETPQQAAETVAALRKVLSVWGNSRLRDAVMAEMASERSPLNGKLKNALKKAASAVKTAAKKVATAVKKAAKKVGSAVKKVTKKVLKVLVRFNPVTLLIRGGLLLFCRLNMFKAANKFYPGAHFKDEAEAKKNGVDADTYKASVEAYGHIKNAYTKIGGKESKLKSAIEKGNKKKWTGSEYPTDEKAIKSTASAATAEDIKELQADIDAETKELTARGATADNTAPTNVETVSTQTTVEIVENERTAKTATNLRETDETTGKVLVSIPKGAKVLVDTAQTSEGFIAATYNGKNGWVTTADLAGLAGCDAESVAVLAVGGIYDNYLNVPGLGVEPVSTTGIAAAASTIATIMAKVKTIFDKLKKAKDTAKKVVDTVKNTVSTVKNTVSTAKQTASAVKSGDIKTAVEKAKETAAAVKTTTDTAKTAAAAVANATAVKKAAAENKATEPEPTPVAPVAPVVTPTPTPIVAPVVAPVVSAPVIPAPLPTPTPAPAPVVPAQSQIVEPAASAPEPKAEATKVVPAAQPQTPAMPAPTPTEAKTSDSKTPYIIGGAAILAIVGAALVLRK